MYKSIISSLNSTMNKNAFYSFLYGVLGALFVQTGLHFYQKQSSIATVNVTGMITGFVKETAAQPEQTLSTEQKQQQVRKFGSAIQSVLERIAKQKKIIIMPSEAIIIGAPDLTQEVMIRIKKEMAT